MDLVQFGEDAFDVYKVLYPYVKKYGIPAFEILKTMIESDIHPDTITNKQLSEQMQQVIKDNQEIQNA